MSKQMTAGDVCAAGAYDFVQRLRAEHDAIKPKLFGTGVQVPFEATVDAFAVLLAEIAELRRQLSRAPAVEYVSREGIEGAVVTINGVRFFEGWRILNDLTSTDEQP